MSLELESFLSGLHPGQRRDQSSMLAMLISPTLYLAYIIFILLYFLEEVISSLQSEYDVLFLDENKTDINVLMIQYLIRMQNNQKVNL